jgi:hypothetical protein
VITDHAATQLRLDHFARRVPRPIGIATRRPKPPATRLAFLMALALIAPGLRAEDRPPAAPLAESNQSALPPAIDLRPQFERFGFKPGLQGERGTCSVFTLLGAIEFAFARQSGTSPRLSVEFLNWASNKACGDRNDGGFFSDLWKGLEGYGVCTAALCPYQSRFDVEFSPSPEALAEAKTRLNVGLRTRWIKEWNVHTGLTDAQLHDIRRTLQTGWPVCGGFRWPIHEQWVDNVLQLCPPDAVRDGHSVLLVGYRDRRDLPGGGAFIFRNSGGNGRDGLMPYAYALTNMNDAVWIQSLPPDATTRTAPARKENPT